MLLYCRCIELFKLFIVTFQINRQVMNAKNERWVSDALYNAVKVIFSSLLIFDTFFNSFAHQFVFLSSSLLIVLTVSLTKLQDCCFSFK